MNRKDRGPWKPQADLRHGEWPPLGHWRHRRPHRGGLFVRFAASFGLIGVLVLGGIAAFASLFSRWFGAGPQMTVIAWAGAAGLSITLPLLAGLLALRAFRGVATPLANVITAADAVAAGNLRARVPVSEHGPDEFATLARSFNRMAEELEQDERRRRNLAADVAHELRNPLHIILGNLEGILDGVYDPTEEHVRATLAETRLLARLVEDLRTLSLAEAGELPLRREPTDIIELVADVQTSFSGQAEAAGINFTVEGGESLPIIVADAARLEQVLSNLVPNAIRHNPAEGRISLQAHPSGRGVRVVVPDTGEGIPREDQPYVYDRFWRGDKSRYRAAGAGTGLGLAIARQLVEAHGGSIELHSRPGRGAQFTIELPSEPVR